MKINEEKCKIMIFNSSRKYDFTPKLTLSDMGSNQKYLEVVESYKLLGLIVRSDMRWIDNTSQMCQKGYKRLWMIRRLKGLGASVEELKDVYIKQVRSVLELAVPAWQPGLTKYEGKQIERVQKCALSIILGKDYISYDLAREKMSIETLSDRRFKLCENFAMKAAKSKRFKHWFSESEVVQNNSNIRTRSRKEKLLPLYKNVPTRTCKYKRSPLPFLTNMLKELKSRKI